MCASSQRSPSSFHASLEKKERKSFGQTGLSVYHPAVTRWPPAARPREGALREEGWAGRGFPLGFPPSASGTWLSTLHHAPSPRAARPPRPNIHPTSEPLVCRGHRCRGDSSAEGNKWQCDPWGRSRGSGEQGPGEHQHAKWQTDLNLSIFVVLTASVKVINNFCCGFMLKGKEDKIPQPPAKHLLTEPKVALILLRQVCLLAKEADKQQKQPRYS